MRDAPALDGGLDAEQVDANDGATPGDSGDAYAKASCRGVGVVDADPGAMCAVSILMRIDTARIVSVLAPTRSVLLRTRPTTARMRATTARMRPTTARMRPTTIRMRLDAVRTCLVSRHMRSVSIHMC